MHARCSAARRAAQLRVGTRDRRRRLSVRETETLVKRTSRSAAGEAEAGPKDVHTRAAEERLRFALGTRVRIVRKERADASRSISATRTSCIAFTSSSRREDGTTRTDRAAAGTAGPGAFGRSEANDKKLTAYSHCAG